MTKIIFAAVVSAATLFATPAIAKDHSWAVGNDQYHVYYTDLDMNSSAGRAQMLARVEKVAGKLCATLIATNRAACVADTIDVATRARGGGVIKLALNERKDVRIAAR